MTHYCRQICRKIDSNIEFTDDNHDNNKIDKNEIKTHPFRNCFMAIPVKENDYYPFYPTSKLEFTYIHLIRSTYDTLTTCGGQFLIFIKQKRMLL